MPSCGCMRLRWIMRGVQFPARSVERLIALSPVTGPAEDPQVLKGVIARVFVEVVNLQRPRRAAALATMAGGGQKPDA
jgi:hypothetical protein